MLSCRLGRIKRIGLLFCLVTVSIWIVTGLPEDAFASRKIHKISPEKLESLVKRITEAEPSAKIAGSLKESSAEVRLSPKISGSLGSLIKSIIKAETESPKVAGVQAGESPALPDKAEHLEVVFELSPAGVDLDMLASRGVVIKNQYKDLLSVKVAPENIVSIVEEFDEIQYARLPAKFFPLAVTSEGLAASGATSFHDENHKGQGVKIAIVDIGFKGLTAAQANLDLPAEVTTMDYSGNGLQTQYVHGTACAEIIHDMAPEAELYLIKIDTEADYFAAVDYCISEGVDVISFSLGNAGSGPGNGTGPICEKADAAITAGILWVSAAGNSATIMDEGTTVGFHWKGTFRNSGYPLPVGAGGYIHQFDPGDYQSIANGIGGVIATDDDGSPETGEITIVLRWNDWPYADVDYDLYVIDMVGEELVIIGSSTGNQNGSQLPLESVTIDIRPPSTQEGYAVFVTKKTGEPSGVDMELFALGTSALYPYYTASSSIVEPADAAKVLAVGAIDYSNWTTGPLEQFSSRGPTNKWAGSSARIKPDICGPDFVSTYSYGADSFPGTSAAAPHVVGAAALILSMHPHYTPDELEQALELNATDMGSTGKDNLYGWGRLKLDMSMNTPPLLEWAGEAGYTEDGLEPEAGYSSTDFLFKVKYKDPDGDAPLVHKVHIDKNGDGDYSDTGEEADMTTGGTDYTTGVIYSHTTVIPYSGNSANCSYYFEFSDNVESATGTISVAISEATAVNKPDVFQTLGITIDKNDWRATPTPVQVPALPQLMSSGDRIKVINTGDGNQTFNLSISDQDVKDEWSAESSEGANGLNKYVLSAVFSGVDDVIEEADYNEGSSDDVVTDLAQPAGATKFAFSSGSQNGLSVTPLAQRHLSFRLDLPTAVAGVNFDQEHAMIVELSCQGE